MNKSKKNTITPFRFAINASRTTSGVTYTETDLTCTNIAGRIADMCYDFEYFRINKLSAYSVASLEPGGIAAPVYILHGVGFDVTPAAFVVTPTSLNRFVAFRHAKIGPKEVTPRISVGPAELGRNRPQRWYHTQATGSPDASESSAGTIYSYLELGCSGTLAVAVNSYVIVEGVIEFSEPVDPTLSRQLRGEVVIPRLLQEDPAVKSAKALLDMALAKADSVAKANASTTPG